MDVYNSSLGRQVFLENNNLCVCAHTSCDGQEEKLPGFQKLPADRGEC